jgi:enterobactin synthetase component D
MSVAGAHDHTRTGGAPALAPIELGLSLAPDIEAVALSLPAAPQAVLDALADYKPPGFPLGAAIKRRAEFLAGRHAAELALSRLGLNASVGRNVDGTPAWPKGVVGSISHGGGLACAIVGHGRAYHSLGVDIEHAIDDRDGASVAASIARPDEILLLKNTLPHARPGERSAVLFSCKESLFKCLFPITREFMEFDDARLIGVGGGSRRQGTLTLRLERPVSDDLPAGTSFVAHFFIGSGRVESAVLLQRADGS